MVLDFFGEGVLSAQGVQLVDLVGHVDGARHEHVAAGVSSKTSYATGVHADRLLESIVIVDDRLGEGVMRGSHLNVLRLYFECAFFNHFFSVRSNSSRLSLI